MQNTLVLAFGGVALLVALAFLLDGRIRADDSERAALEKQVQEAETAYKDAYRKYSELRGKLLAAQHKESPYSGELERARKQVSGERGFSADRLAITGDTLEVGDLRVSLQSFGKENRKLQKKEIVGEPTKFERELWGALVKIENTSEGRIITPFQESSMFSKVTVIDSWDNREVQASFGLFDEVQPQEGAGFELAGTEVLPGKTATFLLVVSDLKVLNFDYVTIKMEVMPSNKGKAETVYFVVPKDKVVGLK
ncbi:MAG: hypothetical protein M5U25_17500 [Planctomycetota bacterium]|nr:hypothetical protein [Planctomycetota bacterium]